MSDEPTREDLLRWVAEGFEASNRGDFEAALAHFSEDVEIYSAQGAGNEGQFQGHDGYRDWAARWFEAWEEFSHDVLRIDFVGEGHLVIETKQTARGRGSGITVERNITYLFGRRGDEVVAMHVYPTWDEAVAVAERRERGDG
jgi:ketosteroid isomerase-like protein